MRVAIMQPYFLPYIGYFQLIGSVDTFVIYDDVNYIKGGWINRNRILGPDGGSAWISLQTKGASPNRLINQVELGGNTHKLLKTIEQRYARAPQFKANSALLSELFDFETAGLSEFVVLQLKRVCRYLGIHTRLQLSSSISKDKRLRGQDKVIAICETLGASYYVNAIGGRDLYEHDDFRERGIELYFIESHASPYRQFDDAFVPDLSIVDVLMFNDISACRALLEEYDLVH